MAKTTEEEINKKGSITFMVIFLALLIFFIQAFRFIKEEGNTHPILSSLFNMTIILGLIILIIHKNEFEKGKNAVLKQTTLDRYFNAIK